MLKKQIGKRARQTGVLHPELRGKQVAERHTGLGRWQGVFPATGAAGVLRPAGVSCVMTGGCPVERALTVDRETGRQTHLAPGCIAGSTKSLVSTEKLFLVLAEMCPPPERPQNPHQQKGTHPGNRKWAEGQDSLAEHPKFALVLPPSPSPSNLIPKHQNQRHHAWGN